MHEYIVLLVLSKSAPILNVSVSYQQRVLRLQDYESILLGDRFQVQLFVKIILAYTYQLTFGFYFSMKFEEVTVTKISIFFKLSRIQSLKLIFVAFSPLVFIFILYILVSLFMVCFTIMFKILISFPPRADKPLLEILWPT